MAYLIDSNCFIQPKNDYYGFDFCPGYWDWLDQQNKLGVVYSIENVASELRRGNDELAEWSKQKDASFFLPTDNPTLSSMTQVVTWVNSANAGFRSEAIPIFMSGADPFLVAYALAHGHTVVSHERLNTNQKRNIKIPAVCQHFGVPHITVFDCLRKTGARLVLL